jgi:hypothetical protein
MLIDVFVHPESVLELQKKVDDTVREDTMLANEAE